MPKEPFHWDPAEVRGYMATALADMAAAGVTHFELMGGRDRRDCRACRALERKRFLVSAPPEVPPPDCSCKIGCRLAALSII